MSRSFTLSYASSFANSFWYLSAIDASYSRLVQKRCLRFFIVMFGVGLICVIMVRWSEDIGNFVILRVLALHVVRN